MLRDNQAEKNDVEESTELKERKCRAFQDVVAKLVDPDKINEALVMAEPFYQYDYNKGSEILPDAMSFLYSGFNPANHLHVSGIRIWNFYEAALSPQSLQLLGFNEEFFTGNHLTHELREAIMLYAVCCVVENEYAKAQTAKSEGLFNQPDPDINALEEIKKLYQTIREDKALDGKLIELYEWLRKQTYFYDKMLDAVNKKLADYRYAGKIFAVEPGQKELATDVLFRALDSIKLDIASAHAGQKYQLKLSINGVVGTLDLKCLKMLNALNPLTRERLASAPYWQQLYICGSLLAFKKELYGTDAGEFKRAVYQLRVQELELQLFRQHDFSFTRMSHDIVCEVLPMPNNEVAEEKNDSQKDHADAVGALINLKADSYIQSAVKDFFVSAATILVNPDQSASPIADLAAKGASALGLIRETEQRASQAQDGLMQDRSRINKELAGTKKSLEMLQADVARRQGEQLAAAERERNLAAENEAWKKQIKRIDPSPYAKAKAQLEAHIRERHAKGVGFYDSSPWSIQLRKIIIETDRLKNDIHRDIHVPALTEILQRTYELSSAQNRANYIHSYRQLAANTQSLSWGKILGGLLLVLAGLALMAVSAASLAGSFGLSAPLAIGGVGVAAAMVTGGATLFAAGCKKPPLRSEMLALSALNI